MYYGCGFDNFNPQKSILAGMTNDQLQLALASAQQAYIDVMTGGKPITVSYANGEGTKTVVYQKSDAMNITMLIMQLRSQLGLSHGRRPMRPVFGAR